jgi:chromosome segregation ATPase
MSNSIKNASPLVKAVVELDRHFSTLERVGTRVAEIELKTDTDFEQARRLMLIFSEAGEGVTLEIGRLSQLLTEARVRSEEIAKRVEARTEELSSRRDRTQELNEEFSQLAAKVGELGAELNEYKRTPGDAVTPEDREQIAVKLSHVGLRLGPMILEAQRIRKEARAERLKVVDQKAESLTKTLQNLQSKLQSLDLISLVAN